MTTDNAANPDPVLSPAPALTDGGEPQELDLLADIQPGGLLDKILGGKNRNSLERYARESLYDKLMGDVKDMREAVQDPANYLELRSVTYKPANIPHYLVTTTSCRYFPDPVLRYCLGRHWRIEDADGKTRSAAWHAYLGHPEAYDDILAEFIPTDFYDDAWVRIREMRFDKGTHPNAVKDWSTYVQRLNKRRSKKLLGISTGLPRLDSALRGLRGLTFLGGGPGAGKTSLALFMAMEALRKHSNLGVLFYSLDMPKTVLMDRLVCQEAGIEFSDLVSNQEDEQFLKKLNAAINKLRSEISPRLRIVERLSVEQNKTVVQLMQDDINRLIEHGPITWVFVIVDYFQLIPVSTKGKTILDADFDRVQSLQRVQAWTRTGQHPDGFPILAISEVRKGESGRTEIGVADLMGSARLGYSAETILLLETPNQTTASPTVPVRLHIAKSRDGTVRGTIDLVFEHTKARFREAPTRPERKPRSEAARETAAPKADQGPIDPLAGLEDS